MKNELQLINEFEKMINTDDKVLAEKLIAADM